MEPQRFDAAVADLVRRLREAEQAGQAISDAVCPVCGSRFVHRDRRGVTVCGSPECADIIYTSLSKAAIVAQEDACTPREPDPEPNVELPVSVDSEPIVARPVVIPSASAAHEVAKPSPSRKENYRAPLPRIMGRAGRDHSCGDNQPLDSEIPMRRCHDCGKPTYDFRCTECRTKWQKKHDVIPSACEDEEWGSPWQ